MRLGTRPHIMKLQNPISYEKLYPYVNFDFNNISEPLKKAEIFKFQNRKWNIDKI